MPAIPTKIRPITGMYKKAVVVDISTALGFGLAGSYAWWYGYHLPAIRHRDRMYAQLEEERAKGLEANPVIPGEDE